VAGGIAAAWGWRGAYLTLAIPTAILGIFFYVYLNRHYSKASIEKIKTRQISEEPPQPGYKRRLWAFLIMMVLGGGAAATVNSFLTLFMVNELGTTKETAAMALAIVFSSGLWAGPLGGWISDRIGSTKVIIVTGLLSGLIIFGLKAIDHPGLALWAVLWFMGLIQAIRFPVTEVFIMSQSTPKYRSTIYGVYYSTMQYTGAIFAPIMGGFIDKFGFHTMYNFAAYAVTGVAIVTSIFIWDAKK
jgi:predicted MFS family arabinose efflux permease